MKSANNPWAEETEYDEEESYFDHKVSEVHFPSDNMTDEEIAEMMTRPTYYPFK